MAESPEQSILRLLCEEAARIVRDAGERPGTYENETPLRDIRIDARFSAMSSFPAAVAALESLPELRRVYGDQIGSRLVLHFIYAFLGSLGSVRSEADAFESVWRSFSKELSTAEWTYVAVANLANFRSESGLLPLDDGVAIRHRSYEELSRILGWDEGRIDATLGRDWEEGIFGSHVILVETKLTKSPDNVVLGNDPEGYAKLSRMLMALRLLKEGDVSVGRVFYARRTSFRIGFRGGTATGFSTWNPGREYVLEAGHLPAVSQVYQELLKLEKPSGGAVRALAVALRSFSSIYDRRLHEVEDRVVDAITAVEAVLRIEAELSFRSGFRVSMLLAADDDERVAIHDLIRDAYDTRSRIVHGGELRPKHAEIVNNSYPAIDLVRRLLRAFVTAAVHGALTEAFCEELDVTLLHSKRRAELRKIMGLG